MPTGTTRKTTTMENNFEIVYGSQNKYGMTYNPQFVGQKTNSKEYYAMMISSLIDSKQRYKEEGNHEWVYRCEVRIQFYHQMLYGEPKAEPRRRERKKVEYRPMDEAQKKFIRENRKWYTKNQLVEILGCHLKLVSEYVRELEEDEADETC